jgi:hypothetical protein
MAKGTQGKRGALIASVALALVLCATPAFALDRIQSSAAFYAETSDGECGLEFTLPWRRYSWTIFQSLNTCPQSSSQSSPEMSVTRPSFSKNLFGT